jgi:hypothetical protein
MKIPQPRRYKSDQIDLESLIGEGENPRGFQAQTANGTAHWQGTGWNQRYWDLDVEQSPPTPVSPAGRSNRTGE